MALVNMKNKSTAMMKQVTLHIWKKLFVNACIVLNDTSFPYIVLH
jgi:hypothetical protein